MNDNPERVAVLIGTRNGEPYLPEQLRSILDQTHPRIDLWFSDDGSTDGTRNILAACQASWPKGRVEILDGPTKGFSENFRSLITNGNIEADYFAYGDQDDVWEPQKLSVAIGWMRSHAADKPMLFCSRTLAITEGGAAMGESPLFRHPPSFRNALVQSIGGGNTMVLNRAARDLVAQASARTGFVSHDWWSYLIVSGAGGIVHYRSEPLVHYRQHGANQVGANIGWRDRLFRLRRLFTGQFKRWTEANMAGLRLNRDLLTPDALDALELFLRSRRGWPWRRIACLRASGVFRQTPIGNIALWLAILMGKI